MGLLREPRAEVARAGPGHSGEWRYDASQAGIEDDSESDRASLRNGRLRTASEYQVGIS